MSQRYSQAVFEQLPQRDDPVLKTMLYLGHLADEDGVASARISAVATGARVAVEEASQAVALEEKAGNLFHATFGDRDIYILMLGRPAKDFAGRGTQQQLRAILVDRFELDDAAADQLIAAWRGQKGGA